MIHRKIHRKNEGLNPAALLKKRLWHRCFSVNLKKFLRTAFFIEHFWTTASGFSYWLHTIRSEKWHLKHFRLNGFPKHIVRLTIWHNLFLEFWLVNPWYFTHWRHQRAVTCLENVRQLNIRRGKKLGFQLSYRQLLKVGLSRLRKFLPSKSFP